MYNITPAETYRGRKKGFKVTPRASTTVVKAEAEDPQELKKCDQSTLRQSYGTSVYQVWSFKIVKIVCI